MCDQDWVHLAMADDSLVVELLLRLNQPLPTTSNNKAAASSPLHLDWAVRQRRSRSASRQVGDDAKKGEPSARASPTTPLSYSGATSVSGGAAGDGSEESSRPTKLVDGSRSKAASPTETTNTKRPRRKKTLAELKGEESLLLKERSNLQHELEVLLLTLEERRARNKSLKRMKLEFQSRQTFKDSIDQNEQLKPQVGSSALISPTCSVLENASQVTQSDNGSAKLHETSNSKPSFLLPDLNLPLEEELDTNLLRGIS